MVTRWMLSAGDFMSVAKISLIPERGHRSNYQMWPQTACIKVWHNKTYALISHNDDLCSANDEDHSLACSTDLANFSWLPVTIDTCLMEMTRRIDESRNDRGCMQTLMHMKRVWRRKDESISYTTVFLAFNGVLLNNDMQVLPRLLDGDDDEDIDPVGRYIDKMNPEDRSQLLHAVDQVLSRDNWDDLLKLDIISDVHSSDDHYVESSIQFKKETDPTGIIATSRSWVAEYQGDAHELLWRHILRYYNSDLGIDRYANICAIVQSSGMGKSRAVDELGKRHLLLPLCLRTSPSGYPPPDNEVRDYLTGAIKSEDIVRGRCLHFLTSLFRHALFELQAVQKSNPEASKQELIKSLYDNMSPSQDEGSRNKYRKDFYQTVISTSSNHRSVVSKQETSPSRNVSQDEKDSLCKAARSLVVFLSGQERPKEVQVLIAFDEAHVLSGFGEETDENGTKSLWSCFTTFRDLFRSLREYAVWGLFLSTTGKLSQFNPNHESESSMRLQTKLLSTNPPFTDLTYDIFAPRIEVSGNEISFLEKVKGTEHEEQPQATTLRRSNRNKRQTGASTTESKVALSLKDITSTGFIVRFGRPMFALRYKNGQTETRTRILEFAVQKLLCDNSVVVPLTNELNTEKMFACLSQRLCLEFNSTSYTVAEEKQVEAHMRICLKIASDNQYIVSTSGSEPLLAEAAAAVMMSAEFKPAKALKQVLTGFSISKGDRGELVAMLAVTVARDQAVQERLRHLDSIENVSLSHYVLSTRLPETIETAHETFRAIPVCDFLKHLFRLNQDQLAKLSTDFRDSYLYFNHFIKAIEQDTCCLPYLLLYMVRGAGYLCANGMPAIDLLLPILFGTTVRVDQTSFILIQVKNDRTTTKEKAICDLFRKMNETVYSLFTTMKIKRPVIRIVFSFGAKPELQYTKSQFKRKGKTYVTHDFWCGGIGNHFLPKRHESDESWEALVLSTMKWTEIFRDEGSKKDSSVRRTLWPCASRKVAHWHWVKGLPDPESEK